jgi:hypothetical protein
MTMNDSGFTLQFLDHAHRMNMLYAFTALCIIYKMAFIIRQVPTKASISASLLRVMCAVVATIVAMKALNRFDGADVATWFDIVRELSWCGFLATAIVVLKEKFGNW